MGWMREECEKVDVPTPLCGSCGPFQSLLVRQKDLMISSHSTHD